MVLRDAVLHTDPLRDPGESTPHRGLLPERRAGWCWAGSAVGGAGLVHKWPWLVYRGAVNMWGLFWGADRGPVPLLASPQFSRACGLGLSVLLGGKSAIFTPLVRAGCWKGGEAQLKGSNKTSWGFPWVWSQGCFPWLCLLCRGRAVGTLCCHPACRRVKLGCSLFPSLSLLGGCSWTLSHLFPCTRPSYISEQLHLVPIPKWPPLLSLPVLLTPGHIQPVLQHLLCPSPADGDAESGCTSTIPGGCSTPPSP